MSSTPVQDTDPWELTFNKEVEYTVAAIVTPGTSFVNVTVGELISQLIIQQPSLSTVADHPYLMRMLACKLWGTPGGSCTLITNSPVNNDSLAKRRHQGYDTGDGVRRPTCDYTWNHFDSSYLHDATTANTNVIAIVAVTPPPLSGAYTGTFYFKCAIHTDANAPLAATRLTSGVEETKKNLKRDLNDMNIEMNVSKVKRRTLPNMD